MSKLYCTKLYWHIQLVDVHPLDPRMAHLTEHIIWHKNHWKYKCIVIFLIQILIICFHTLCPPKFEIPPTAKSYNWPIFGEIPPTDNFSPTKYSINYIPTLKIQYEVLVHTIQWTSCAAHLPRWIKVATLVVSLMTHSILLKMHI